MFSQTRLLKVLQEFFSKIKVKSLFFQKTFSLGVFFLFIGFLLGNLFGTFLESIRSFLNWDGLIILTLIFLIEIISYILYHKQGRSFFFFWRVPFFFRKLLFWKSFNYFKIGLMLGFFIDAFKVGS